MMQMQRTRAAAGVRVVHFGNTINLRCHAKATFKAASGRIARPSRPSFAIKAVEAEQQPASPSPSQGEVRASKPLMMAERDLITP
jgi:hypothetical protein